MKKKIIVPMILAFGMQMPLMAMDSKALPNKQSAQNEQQEGTSWTKVGWYTAGSALGGYGLYKGYKWLTYKKPIAPPTFFEKLAAQVPGGNAVLPAMQKTASLAKKHSYITSALAVAVAGILGYKYILEPEMRAARAEELKYYIDGICNHSFATTGHSSEQRMTALWDACEYAKGLAVEFDDVALIRNVNELITYYTKQAPKDVEALGNLNRQLGTKKAALFKRIDEIHG